METARKDFSVKIVVVAFQNMGSAKQVPIAAVADATSKAADARKNVRVAVTLKKMVKTSVLNMVTVRKDFSVNETNVFAFQNMVSAKPTPIAAVANATKAADARRNVRAAAVTLEKLV